MRILSGQPASRLELPPKREGKIHPSLMAAFVSPSTGPAPAARLSEPGALVVTTGQQPGLLTGPLYTIYKAISAAMLAKLLEERWRRPVVPVFWVAGDDHDLAEAASVAWAGPDGTTVRARLRERPAEAPMAPMYREQLGSEIEMILAGIEAALPPGEHRDTLVATLRRHYYPEATVAASFAGLLGDWLAPLGVAVFDPTHPAAKTLQAPLLLRALSEAGPIEALLAARHQELVGKREDPGVPVAPGATLVMLEASSGRDRLMLDGEGYRCRRSRERFTADDLARIGLESPGRLSANVLLRPVVESALLPTVAYVAGPAERRYLALAEPLHAMLSIPGRATVGRWSGTLVEPRVERVLAKYGVTLDRLLEPHQALEASVVRDQLPPEAAKALAHLQEGIRSGYETLARAALEIDPTIERSIRGLAGQALGGIADAEKRLLSHLKKRQATETSQIARAREAVLPGGEPQERVLNIAPWLARHGSGLLQEIAAVVEGWYRESLEPPPSRP